MRCIYFRLLASSLASNCNLTTKCVSLHEAFLSSFSVCACLVWPGAVRAPWGDAGGAGGASRSSSSGNGNGQWNGAGRHGQERASQRPAGGGPGLQWPCCSRQRRVPQCPGQGNARRTLAYTHTLAHAQPSPAHYCFSHGSSGTVVNAFQQPQSEKLSFS